MQKGITACVITRDEGRTIERCLKSLKFADEIVVIDSGSRDFTVELARRYTDRVITREWTGFAAQRNACLDAAKYEWVFFLDADEQADVALGEKLCKIASEDASKHPNCYSIKRIEYFLGQQLNYGPGNPSFQWRFFKREKVRFEGGVHEYPRFEGAVGLIDDVAIHHWPDLGIDKFLNKLNHYTTLEAIDRFAQGKRTTLFHAFGTFFTTLLKNGIRYRGFWNGRPGFVLTTLEAMSRVVRHLKLWVFWQVHDGRLKIDLGIKLPEPGSLKPPSKAELEPPVWDGK